MDDMTRGYLACALWLATDGDLGEIHLDETHDITDFAEESVRRAGEVCRDFARANASDLDAIDMEAENVGHNFFLTRNGHGSGFWDRGLGIIGDRLTKACKAYGESGVYVGDDGRLYLS